MNKMGRAVVAIAALVAAGAVQAEELKVAIGQRGAWDTSIVELGNGAGIFKKHDLDLNILWTQGGGETQQAVISRSVDIGVAVGTLGALGVAAKGAPIKIIGGEATGINEFYWYVPIASPIKTVADLAGRTVAYSTAGSSSHTPLLMLQKEKGIAAKPIATGGLALTLTQAMSGQVDVGWAVAPFNIDNIGKTVRIIMRGNEIAGLRNQTTRVLITNNEMLANKRDTIERFLAAYRETIDWMYASPDALKDFAKFAGVSDNAARRTRDEFFPKEGLDPGRITGLDALMADGIQFKFLAAPLSREQLGQIMWTPTTAK